MIIWIWGECVCYKKNLIVWKIAFVFFMDKVFRVKTNTFLTGLMRFTSLQNTDNNSHQIIINQFNVQELQPYQIQSKPTIPFCTIQYHLYGYISEQKHCNTVTDHCNIVITVKQITVTVINYCKTETGHCNTVTDHCNIVINYCKTETDYGNSNQLL